MAPHKLRVIAEKAELDARIEKLGVFLSTLTFGTLDSCDKVLLSCQYTTMKTLSGILGARINRFKCSP